METRAQHTKSLLWLGVLLVSVLGLARVPTALEIGEPAPDFTLPSTTGGQISLSQFRGKHPVLLEFYGADFSPACEANLGARKADYSKFQDLHVQILGISANNPFSQKMLANSLQLPYPLLSDSTLSVIKAYGVLYGAPKGKTTTRIWLAGSRNGRFSSLMCRASSGGSGSAGISMFFLRDALAHGGDDGGKTLGQCGNCPRGGRDMSRLG